MENKDVYQYEEKNELSSVVIKEWIEDLQRDIMEIKTSIKNLQRCGRMLRKSIRKMNGVVDR